MPRPGRPRGPPAYQTPQALFGNQLIRPDDQPTSTRPAAINSLAPGHFHEAEPAVCLLETWSLPPGTHHQSDIDFVTAKLLLCFQVHITTSPTSLVKPQKSSLLINSPSSNAPLGASHPLYARDFERKFPTRSIFQIPPSIPKPTHPL